MGFFRKIAKVFRAYTDLDKVFSYFCIGLLLLMVLKMVIFPYGMFNFGKVDIYTEGLVGPNGFQNLNPVFVDYNYVDREACSLVFSGLMKYNPDTEAIVEDMATLTIDQFKTEYTFVLKDGIKWHDGKPLTADDAYFTFADVIQDPTFPNEILKANFDGVTVEKIDDKTIKFKLKKPNVFFVSSLTTGILPKHILENVPVTELLENDFNKMPIGSGPYKVAEPIEAFKDGRMQVTLHVNENYYGINSQIKEFRFIYYATMDQLLDESNAVNGIVKVYGSYVDELKETGDFVLIPYELPQYMAVFINMDSPKVQDKLIRIALEKAIDKKELLSKLSDKLPIDTPLLELDQSKWAYQPSKENADGALLEAGYKYSSLDSKYRLDSDGKPLKLRLIARKFDDGTQQASETKVVTDFLKQKWEAVGTQIDVALLGVSELNERIMDRNYDLLFIGQTLGYSNDLYSYWHSTQVGANGLNLSNYKSFQVDSLIEDMRVTFDPERRLDKLKMIADRLSEDIPAIFLYKPVYYYASDGKVDGINMKGLSFSSDRFWAVSSWKFTQ